ncbi:SDR family NAD(P)-dependent oxidoreductase [Priestia endophytica]|uniref:SDR family NAD(P)-dependent oxidoreductase n=1 Tax=Priestia endophytica TaxID=135735 RepID=UPI002E2132D1|nr:SDR family NAD(P)-dependent oxidoreductase [Priestia endophytica]
MYTSLKGKNVVLTGSTGRVGTAISELYAKLGSNLILLDIEDNKQELEEQVSYLKSIGAHVRYYKCDLSQIEQIKDTCLKIKEEYEHVDILINNAGTSHIIPATQVTPEIWDRIMDVNLKGTFFMSQYILPLMIRKKEGCIVNVASQHGIVTNKDRAAYGASKAGVIHLTKSLAYEWAKYRIRVNTVSPTVVISDSNTQLLESPAYKKEYLNKIPLKKYATPIDVANSILYLTSELSNMVTGHNLVVDGGWTVV